MNEEQFMEVSEIRDDRYSYLATLSSTSNALYNGIVILVVLTIAALPFIYVDVNSTAMASIQTAQQMENVYVPVGGKIARLNIVDNHPVKSGDTLAVVEYGYESVLLNNAQPKPVDRQSKRVTVLANIAGICYKSEGLQVGTYVQAGQKVGEVIPDTGLVAVCLVASKDIGFVKPGQLLQLQIDSYNYYEWGSLQAKVKEIFTEVVFVENKPFYIVRCDMDKTYLSLKNGYKGSIKKGMTGRANFVLSRRSLWQLLFTKVNDWVNPKAN